MPDKPERRGRGRPRTVDREAVVTAAMTTWWSEGVESVSLNAISRRTGLSKSSLYREFGGEDGLMAAALERYRQLSVVPLLELFGSGGDPAATLAVVVHGSTEPHGLPPGCFFTKLRLAPGALGETTARAVARILAERRSAFENWYRGVLDRGAGNPELSSAAAARYLDAQLTLILVRLAAGDTIEAVRSDARLALQVLVGPGDTREEPEKDGETERPVPEVWRPTIVEIVRRFVQGDYALTTPVPGVAPVGQDTAEQVRDYVEDYGMTLVALGAETWDSSVCSWTGDKWQVLVDLWTAEEGPSDMVLHLNVYEDGIAYRFEVYLVYVP